EHFNLISALHKSVRNSDPDAALYWLARMLESGEDPLYLARRMVRMASEDIGLAEPGALAVTLAAKDAFDFLGAPQGNLRPASTRPLSRLPHKIDCPFPASRQRDERRPPPQSRSRPAASPQRRHSPHGKYRLRQRLQIRP